MVKVQAYIKSLLDKVDSLEVTHASISSFLRTNHITSITREKTQLESQLASKVQLDTSTEFVCQELGVVKEGKCKSQIPFWSPHPNLKNELCTCSKCKFNCKCVGLMDLVKCQYLQWMP